tara:strand:+ start:1947 stop:2768 length:822 start_codon:yes stop_codon:yes gene_type:complete
MSKIIWSKGLINKDKYCLEHTSYISNKKEIENQINKSTDKLWIRNNCLDLYFVNELLNKPLIIYISDGDATFPYHYNKDYIHELLNNSFVLKIYAQNYNEEYLHPKLFHYPIGFDLHTTDWFIGNNSYNKIKYIIQNRDNNKLMRCLCDCHININNSSSRLELRDIKNDFIDKLSDRVEIDTLINKYYSRYQFIISTHGNGLDCHRTYEALLSGAIVIHKHSVLDTLFKQFPIVLIDDWNEINMINLNKWYKEYKPKTNIQNILKLLSYNNYE